MSQSQSQSQRRRGGVEQLPTCELVRRYFAGELDERESQIAELELELRAEHARGVMLEQRATPQPARNIVNGARHAALSQRASAR